MPTICCPQCRSTTVHIVGAMLISPVGIPYVPGVKLSDVPSESVSMTREFLRCEECRHQFKLSDGQEAAGLDVEHALWEVTEHGIRIPIICPKCGNQKHFVRSVLELLRKDEDVLVEEGKAELQFVGGGVVVDHRAILSYVCAEEDCNGVVALFSNDFHIVHTN